MIFRAMQLKDKIEGSSPSKEAVEKEKPEAVPIEPEETEIQRIGSISMKNEKDLAGVESIQEKISKGLRDIFGKKDGADAEEEQEADSFSSCCSVR